MSLTPTISQHVIQGAPRSPIVRSYSLESIAGMEVDFRAALPQEPPFAVGVSIELAPVGPNINTLALAIQDQVFCLTIHQTPSRAQKMSVRKILDVQYLSGFEFPHTIVLLARTLGSNVSGYDLSTLINGEIKTPGDFFYKYESIPSRSINELWDGPILRGIDAKAAGTLEPNYALRAWLTAMCVILTPLAFFDHPFLPQRCKNGYSRLAIGSTIKHGMHYQTREAFDEHITIATPIHLLPSADASNLC
jgi:hypothetical protein